MSGKSFKRTVVLIAALAVAAGASWWFHKTAPAKPGPTFGGASPPGSIQTPATKDESPGARELALQSAADDLAAANTTQAKSLALARLRSVLATGTPNETSAAIRRLLDAKTDAATGQSFKLGGNGSLREAPTLRTFLLDQLARLDPVAAAAHARIILETSASPDEWAVALRNLARGDTSAEGRAVLEARTSELLRNESWQHDPSVGYLEAFDTAVHLGGTNLLSPLSDLVRKKDNQAVAHAAFLTLDRLVINQPGQTLAALNEHPEWMTGREETRANYFARADVGDAEQRRLVESYLLAAARSPAELESFAGVFPNANFMISQNLLTGNATLDHATLRRRDQAALEVVNQWLSDPRFEKVRLSLTKMQQRLKEFTPPAK